MQRDIITSTITWHLGLVGSNNFSEYTSFGPFTLLHEFQQKLSTLSKACDVTWPEKCRQTSANSSISSVPCVLNISKKWNIWKLFSEHEIFHELVKNCEVLLYSFIKTLDAPAGIDGLYLICRCMLINSLSIILQEDLIKSSCVYIYIYKHMYIYSQNYENTTVQYYMHFYCLITYNFQHVFSFQVRWLHCFIYSWM